MKQAIICGKMLDTVNKTVKQDRVVFISDERINKFVPMNANFGIFNGPKDKEERVQVSLRLVDEFRSKCPWINI